MGTTQIVGGGNGDPTLDACEWQRECDWIFEGIVWKVSKYLWAFEDFTWPVTNCGIIWRSYSVSLVG